MNLLDQIPERLGGQWPKWWQSHRNAAATVLRNTGLPHRKVEAWRFTPIEAVTSVPFTTTTGGDAAPARESIAAITGSSGAPTITMINGALSDGTALPAGVTAEPLAAALARAPAALEPWLGKIAGAEHFAALNSALAEGGVVITVAPGTVCETPVHLVHVSVAADGPSASYPRVLVVAGENSQLTLVETFVTIGASSKTLTAPVTEVALEPAAIVSHTRVALGQTAASHLATLAVRQDRDSSYRLTSVALGGSLSRLELKVALAGKGAECDLAGVYHAASKEVVDHHVYVDHIEPNCNSNQVFRGIIDGSGHGVFDGISVVRRDAQHTAAHQENRNLLLSDNAKVHTKPHLEIDADDIVASHGATIGALDDGQLFYLQSRGIDADKAHAILTYAFVKEIVDEVGDDHTRARLAALIADRLPHGDTIRGMSDPLAEIGEVIP